MSGYYGDFLVSKSVRCRFNTVNSAGIPTSLASGAVTVTKDGADVTPSGGVILTADVGAVVGRNHVVIDMSVDTTTFTAGSEYSVRLSGTTNVGGTSVVGIVVGEWSVQNRSAPTAAAITTAVLTTQMTESYNADGVAPTLAQGVFLVMQRLNDFTISGNTITIHKLDGTTTAFVLTTGQSHTSDSATRSA